MNVHEVLAWTLLTLVGDPRRGGHLASRRARDATLRRMLPRPPASSLGLRR